MLAETWARIRAPKTVAHRPRQHVVDTGGQLAWPIWTPRHDLRDTYLPRTLADRASLDRTPPPRHGVRLWEAIGGRRTAAADRAPPLAWLTDMGVAVRVVN